MKSTIGEYIERDHLINNNRKDILEAFHLVTGEKYEIDIRDLFLNTELPIVKDYNLPYTDTCGLATHTKSEYAIRNALYEFIERQSLIMTWLGKLNSTAIPDTLIKRYINTKNVELKNFQIFARDISLWSFIKVIIFIGYNENSGDFIIGCSAHHNFKTALQKAYSEAIGIIKNKYLLKNIYSTSNYNPLNPEYHDDSYTSNFFSMSLLEFKKRVQFLINGNKELGINYLNAEPVKTSTLKNLEINIYCTFIPYINSKEFKTVKVFSPDAFPHMKTETLVPEDYKISSLLKLSNFPNKFKVLPFP